MKVAIYTRVSAGKQEISIMATIAKQENIRRSELVKAGLARGRRQGSRFGRPRVADAKASRTRLWRRSRGYRVVPAAGANKRRRYDCTI
jgi:DNA invertase Pin-like site-specific DNA recombinase